MTNFANMKLTFSIEYRAPFGQSMHVCISYITKDGHQYDRNVLMRTDDGVTWKAETLGLIMGHSSLKYMTYYYQLEDNNSKICRKEWNAVPRCYVLNQAYNYLFQDLWRDLALSRYLFPLSRRERTPLDAIPQFNRSVIFCVSAPQVADHQVVALLGSEPTLGRWNEKRYLPLQYIGNGNWMLSINADAMELPFEYKYVVVDKARHDTLTWENGHNRTITLDYLNNNDQLIIFGGSVRTPSDLVFKDEIIGKEQKLKYEIRDLYI